MGTMENYQFVFRLRDLAAIKICKYLWRLPGAKQFIELSLRAKLFSPTTEVAVYIKGSELTDEINKLALPEELKRELTNAFKSMACKIFYWYHAQKPRYFNKAASQLLRDYICWTDDGRINTSKTLTGLYNSNKLVNNYITWLMLCHNCLENCIRDLWPKLDKNTLKRLRKIRADTNMLFDIPVFYWLYRMSDNENEKSTLVNTVMSNHESLYDKEVSIEENMFIFSVLGHNYEALKYFWEFYDDDQKMRVITRSSMTPLYYAKLYACTNSPVEGSYEDGRQIIMFLMRQFLNYEMDDALITLLHKTNILVRFMYWPWQDLFMRIIEEPRRYHGRINSVQIVMMILNYFEKNNPTRNDLKFHTIFHEIWSKNPDDFKKLIEYETWLDQCFWRMDIARLKFLMNDEYFREPRKAHLDGVFTLVSREAPYSKDFVHKFMEEVLVCDEERDRLKLIIEDYLDKHSKLFLFSYPHN